MEFDLSPKLAKKVYGGDGGSYHAWCPKELPMLKEGNIGAAKLALEKNGLALPHYCDSAKVAYVLQGNGVAGIVLPEKEEKVVSLKKGDAIAIPFGVVTWWYNKEDTELVVLFLGDTKTAHKVGEFTNFYLTGSNGIFTGFSSEFVGRAWDVDEKTVKALVSSQSAKGIVKVDPSIKMPEPKTEHRQGFVYNCEEAPLDVDIKGGGKVVVLNTKNLPLVAEVGTGADLVRLDPGAMCSPGFSCDSALQVTYIVSGSGRAQIVGVDGKRVLETTVKAGHLFIVPRFFAVSKICDPSGMSWFSIISTPDPIFTHLAGKTSVWKALSPGVLQAAFKVAPDVENLFRSKRMNEEIFFPPPKIDLLLQGGLREGELTELAGMSSAGKTQVCLRVASNVAMQHAGIVVYMDTGNSFSSQRIEHFLHKVSDPHFHQSRKSVVQKVMSNIMCHSVFDIFTMFDVLNKLEVNLRSQGYSKGCKIRLLIVDSISSLITPILGGGGSQGHALMISAGYLLKKLAHEHNIVALVTNHMVGGEGGNPKPALGESWKSIPHVRLLISSDRASNICSISILKHHSLASCKGAELMVTD